MKQFYYFESHDGGMGQFEVLDTKDLSYLYGWMTHGCKMDDKSLIEWMKHAQIGEKFDHRLGVLVRLKDLPPTKID